MENYKERIRTALQEEREKYENERLLFYSNPLHWSNNKRKINGLHTLRGQVNSVRCKKFHSFYPTAHLFPLFEEIIDETLKDKFQNDKYFYNFVTFNNLFY